MADNVQVTAGSGTTIATDDVGGGVQGPCEEHVLGRDPNGYGRINVIRYGKRIKLAHVLAWVEHHGRLPMQGLVICHKCNNPPCKNVDHLYEGTYHQNIMDSITAGTHVSQTHPEIRRGERNGQAKLTELQVLEIRNRLQSGYRGLQKQLATEFGVSQATISLVKTGKHWGWTS